MTTSPTDWIRRGRRAAALVLIAGSALGTIARGADAAPRTSSLAWVRMPGAEGCIDARALALAVERRLGRAAFVPPTLGDVAIEGRIERSQEAGVWRATIRVFGAGGAAIGSRELESDQVDCRAIDDQLELVIALLIDPDASLAPPGVPAPSAGGGAPSAGGGAPSAGGGAASAGGGAPSASGGAPSASGGAPSAGGGAPSAGDPTRMVQLPPRVTWPAVPPPCPPAPATPSAPWRVGAAVDAVGGLGLVPGPASVGVGVRAHVAPPRGPGFELGGVMWASPVISSAPGSPEFSLAYGTLSVCPLEIARGGTALSGCLGATLGSLRVSGSELPSRFRKERLHLDLSLDARARQRFVGPLFGAVGLGIAVPTVRDVYFYTDAAGARHDVFQASPVAAILGLGLGVEMP